MGECARCSAGHWGKGWVKEVLLLSCCYRIICKLLWETWSNGQCEEMGFGDVQEKAECRKTALRLLRGNSLLPGLVSPDGEKPDDQKEQGPRASPKRPGSSEPGPLVPCFDRKTEFCQGAATTFTATSFGRLPLCAVVCVNPVKWPKVALSHNQISPTVCPTLFYHQEWISGIAPQLGNAC